MSKEAKPILLIRFQESKTQEEVTFIKRDISSSLDGEYHVLIVNNDDTIKGVTFEVLNGRNKPMKLPKVDKSKIERYH